MCGASKCGGGQIKPDLAECEGAGLERADAGDDVRKAAFPIVSHQGLPVGPVAVFEHAPDKPGGVFFKVDVLRMDVPEEVLRESGHGGGFVVFVVFACGVSLLDWRERSAVQARATYGS